MSDLSALQGKWQVTSLEIDGATLPASIFARAEIHVSGDDFISSGMGADYRGKVSVDANAAPSAFTLTFANGPEAGNANHGVFEVAGDVWRFCIDMKGGPAPADFTTAPGSGRALQTLIRKS